MFTGKTRKVGRRKMHFLGKTSIRAVSGNSCMPVSIQLRINMIDRVWGFPMKAVATAQQNRQALYLLS